MADSVGLPGVFILGSDGVYEIYISPNASHIPAIPSTEQSPVSLYSPLEPQWARDADFYMSFIPERDPFDDPVLAALDPGLSTVEEFSPPGAPGRRMYRLCSRAIEDWLSLEKFLIQVERCLLSWGNLHLPLDFRAPRLPSTYQFDQPFATRKAARRAVSLARAAFLPWAALVNFHIVRLETVVPFGRQHPWFRGMPLDKFMKPSVVSLLRSSWVSKFYTPPRLGGFIDFTRSSPTWLSDFSLVLKVAGRCVPFWFYFGEDPTACLNDPVAGPLFASARSKLERILSREKEIRAEQAQLHQQSLPVEPAVPASYGWSKLPPPRSIPVVDPAAPAPKPSTRQLRGETLFGFLAREREHAERYIANELQRAREKRLQRQKEVLARPYPIRKGPAVFHWVKQRGYWMRELVWVKRYQALWKDTAECHRVYNSVRNEWDVSHLLCVPDGTTVDEAYEGWDMLTPDVVYDEEGFDSDDDYMAGGVVGLVDQHTGGAVRNRERSRSPLRSPSTSSRPTQEVTINLSTAAYALLADEDRNTSDADASLAVEDLLTVFAARYGFRAELPYETPDREEGEIPMDLKTALRAISHLSHSEDLFRPEVAAVRDFVESFIADGEAESPARLFSDLLPTNARHSSLLQEIPTVVRRMVDAGGDTSYVLQPQHEPQSGRHPWKLVVTSAITALEVVRRKWGPGKDDIVLELIQRGIPFSTLMPSTTAPLLANASAISVSNEWEGLGYRQPGYKPTVLDYALYERHRRIVLQRPGARSALMRGGIVWRLAYEEVDPDRVLLGQQDAEQRASRVLGGTVHDDSTLSEEELYVICGVYRVYAGALPSRPPRAGVSRLTKFLRFNPHVCI